MDKWTFGIITGGEYPIDDVIASINALGIPDDKYEIIVVGGRGIQGKNVVHVEFNEAAKRMWITKKKQVICERAKFENVVLTHDYILFDPDWYNGWLKFGDNDWDVAMTQIKNADGLRFRDWVCQNPLSLVPYDMVGYNPALYISGTYWCAKKQFMLKHPLDVTRIWNEWEDIEWSFRCRTHWKYKMNPHSAVRSKKQKETWGVQGDTGVHTSIHYTPLAFILNAVGDIKVADDNGRLVVEADRGVRSIHYGEFDWLRNELRRIKPKTVAVVGDPFGLTSFAAAWAAKDYGGVVKSYDYGDGSYGLRLGRILARQFQWEDHWKLQAISQPSDLSQFGDADLVILSGTYSGDRKLDELSAIPNKPIAYVNNGHSPNLVAALKNRTQDNDFCIGEAI